MKANIFKNRYLRNGTLMLFSSLFYSLYTHDISYAGKTTPYYYEGTSKEYSDPDVPPAVKLTEAVDGMPKGTILYRTEYLDFTYYCPVAPKNLQNTAHEPASNKNFRKWGPWDMAKNKVAYQETLIKAEPGFIPSSYTYSSVTIPKGTHVEGIKVDSDGADYRTDLGALTETYTGKIKSVTNYRGSNDPHVYFDLTNTNLKGKGAVNIGRVPRDVTTNRKGKKEFYHDDSRPVYDRFSKYGRYVDEEFKGINVISDDSHTNVKSGKWVNASYAPSGLAGLNGEWTYLGYNADGDPLRNPYMIDTSLYFRGNSALKEYDLRYTPWDASDSKSGETEFKKTQASQQFPKLTKYDKEKKYYNLKYNMVEKLIKSGVFKRRTNLTLKQDVEDLLNRISFRNHPENEACVMIVQRRMNDSTRYFTVLNELNDIYLHSMIVTDSSGKEVASYTYDIETKKATRKNASKVKVGEEYTVKVYLGNAKGREIIATKNHAQLGVKTHFKANNSMPISSTTNVQSKEITNSMEAKKGSKSKALTFKVTAPDVDFFDIYGYVGEKHLGTDNLDESNDIGRVRMNIRGDNYKDEPEYQKADIVAKKIELLEKDGTVVYSFTRGASSPSVNKGIIPGKKYDIKFTITDDSANGARYRVKSAGHYNDDGQWIPGTTGSWKYLTDCSVNAKHTYTRIGSGTNNSTDVIPPSQKFTVSKSKAVTVDGSTTFSLKGGTTLTYSVPDIVFEYPYAEIGFSITGSEYTNSNTTNDSLSVTIQPKYDAVIGNVKIQPQNEYTDGNSKKVSYLVTYDAKLDVPSYMQNNDVAMLIETSINIGDKTVVFPDLLSAGENKNISHSVNDIPISNAGSVTATVFLNYHKHTYETNYDNNKATATASIKNINNPFNGSNTDKATSFDTSTGSSAVGGGSLNNNCLIPRRENNWSVSHRKLGWNTTQVSYGDTTAVPSFKKYSITSNTTPTATNYYESYNIESILFRSKDTKDKGLGTDGWINLLESSEKDLATIKAGYGFELKVITKYKTNAKKAMPSSTNFATSSSGTYYSGTSRDASISLAKDIFIELPGSDSTRKILSTTGYNGTTKGITVTEKDESTSDETIKKFTYTIKATNTLGINSDKIFIPKSLKDGNYKISIYTPPVTGMPSVGKNEYTALCDRKDFNIKVKGSYTNDLNSHTTQQ